MREKPAIPDELLLTFLQQHYKLTTTALHFLPLGLDTRAGVYQVISQSGVAYLLKVKSRAPYLPSYFVPRYLADQNITAVIAPIPTINQTLWSALGDWNLALYPFKAGMAGWETLLSDEQWQTVGKALRQIHDTAVPLTIFTEIHRESFEPAKYLNWIDRFEAYNLYLPEQNDRLNKQTLRASWTAHQATIHAIATTMTRLAQVLQKEPPPLVICHADLHPGNLIRANDGQVFIIDWDEVKLAPRERDFLFVEIGETAKTGKKTAGQATAPFFQGYGEIKIDWVALTYHRCERVIEDLIACAEDVLFRPDLDEETKAEAVKLFNDIFAEGSELDSALAAATQLPPDLNFTG